MSGKLIFEEKRTRRLFGGQEAQRSEGKLFNNSSIDEIPQKPINDTVLSSSGFADGRNKVSPDSEQMELTGTECRKRHSVSVEQIQDNSPIALSPDKTLSTIQHFNHSTNNDLPSYLPTLQPSKKAFTLAEVLITLAVVGVIAAVTIPLIHSKIQNYVLKNRFKKVYNTYMSAIHMINTENGGIYSCYYLKSGGYEGSECNNFFIELSKKLKYVKYCSNHALANGCIPIYSKYYSRDDSSCYAFKQNYVNNKSKAWVLNDGSIIFTYDSGHAPLFAVDINGFSKPNKGGYDLFVFNVIENGNTVILGEKNCSNSFIENGGKTLKEMLLN